MFKPKKDRKIWRNGSNYFQDYRSGIQKEKQD